MDKLQSMVLICDESGEVRESIKNMLKPFGLGIIESETGEEAVESFKSYFFNLVILDPDIKDADGVEILYKIKSGMNPNVNIILITENPKLETAIAGIKLGVSDYLIKPINEDEIVNTINKILDKRQVTMDKSQDRRVGLGSLIGASPKMQLLYSKILSVAPTDSSVCIQGESGVGKELVAKTIHELSLRNDGPFIPIECSGITETLFESELFGHMKGAFSGAIKDNIGLFRSGNGGTIFLDEIGDVPLTAQVKLLRTLEERKVRPIGSNKNYEIDVRILTATNRNLERALLEGKIRRDFFHRFYVIPITVPPLREHREDIPALAKHFVEILGNQNQKHKQVANEILDTLYLSSYDWPGNVRELQNIIEQAFVASTGNLIKLNDLPPLLRPILRPTADILPWSETQKALIQKTLQKTEGNKSQAAKLLGITRMTLHRKLKEYKIT